MIFDIFGTGELLDPWDFTKLITRLAIDGIFTWFIVNRIYSRLYPANHDFVLTYYIFNLITFSLCVLLRKVPMEIGFALGLFAVFGILRYRTEEIKLRDLTYLFIVIGIAILNSVANKKISLLELLAVNVAIAAVTATIELTGRRDREEHTPVLYDNLPLLAPGREAELREDLTRRTGFSVVRVRVDRIDLLRDAAEITAFFVRKP